jgi:uncharacterized protein YjiS (DUF1127 family)
MSYAAHRRNFGSLGSYKAPPTDETGANKWAILRRMYEAILESRLRELEAPFDCRVAQTRTAKLVRTVALRWKNLRSVWMLWTARNRFCRSIAHLDDRLLADIGLGPQDLGFTERFVRGHVVDARIWIGGKTRGEY